MAGNELFEDEDEKRPAIDSRAREYHIRARLSSKKNQTKKLLQSKTTTQIESPTHYATDTDTDTCDAHSHSHSHSHSHIQGQTQAQTQAQIDLQKQSCYTIVNDMAYTYTTPPDSNIQQRTYKHINRLADNANINSPSSTKTFHLPKQSIRNTVNENLNLHNDAYAYTQAYSQTPVSPCGKISAFSRDSIRDNLYLNSYGGIMHVPKNSDISVHANRKEQKTQNFETVQINRNITSKNYEYKYETKAEPFRSNDLYDFLAKLTDNQVSILQRYVKTDASNSKETNILQQSEARHINITKNTFVDEVNNKSKYGADTNCCIFDDSNSIPKLRDLEVLRKSSRSSGNKTNGIAKDKKTEKEKEKEKEKTFHKSLHPKTPKEKPQSHTDCLLPLTPPTVCATHTHCCGKETHTNTNTHTNPQEKTQTQTQTEYPSVSKGPPSLKCESSASGRMDMRNTQNDKSNKTHPNVQFKKLHRHRQDIKNENFADVYIQGNEQIIDDVLTPRVEGQISRQPIPPLTLPTVVHPPPEPEYSKPAFPHIQMSNNWQTYNKFNLPVPIYTKHGRPCPYTTALPQEYNQTDIYVGHPRQPTTTTLTNDCINPNLFEVLQDFHSNTMSVARMPAPTTKKMSPTPTPTPTPLPCNYPYQHVSKINTNVHNNNTRDTHMAELQEVDDILSIITSLPQC